MKDRAGEELNHRGTAGVDGGGTYILTSTKHSAGDSAREFDREEFCDYMAAVALQACTWLVKIDEELPPGTVGYVLPVEMWNPDLWHWLKTRPNAELDSLNNANHILGLSMTYGVPIPANIAAYYQQHVTTAPGCKPMKYKAPKALGKCTAVGCALVEELDGMTAADWLAMRPAPSETTEAPAAPRKARRR